MKIGLRDLYRTAWADGRDLGKGYKSESVPNERLSLLGVEPRKRPDYTHVPDGALVWLLLLITPAVLEVIAAFSGRIEYTFSRTVWWALGPPYEPRWWLLGMPFAAFCMWLAPHFLWPHYVTGIVLGAMVAIALVIGIIGVLAT